MPPAVFFRDMTFAPSPAIDTAPRSPTDHPDHEEVDVVGVTGLSFLVCEHPDATRPDLSRPPALQSHGQ